MKNIEICGAKEFERDFINKVLEMLQKNYSDVIDISKLQKIEIVDELSGGSSGRAIRYNIILPRKLCLDILTDVDEFELEDMRLKNVISVIFHELWHVSTYERYKDMYEYVYDETTNEITAVSYVYWIEYIAHKDTVFMEDVNVMKKFCFEFVRTDWLYIEDGYMHFIKGLAYYLVRSEYLNILEEMSQRITCKELRKEIHEIDILSQELFARKDISDMEKANFIRKHIKNVLKKMF